MPKSTLPEYVIRTKIIKEGEFHTKISELEGLVIVDKSDKMVQVKYKGTVEDLYQALGYSKKEVIIEPLITIPLPTQPRPFIKTK